MACWHTVVAGDCLHSLAAEYGFADGQRIYDHPNNASLKTQRPNPALLLPGDQIYIPDVMRKTVPCATGKLHRFVVKRATVLFSLVLKDASGQALASKRYRLKIEGERREGTTGGDGKLEQMVPARAKNADLWVWLSDAPPAEEAPTNDNDDDLRAPDDGDDAVFGSTDNSQGDGGDENAESGDEEDDTRGPHVLHFSLQIGHLDPHDTESGLQQRLNNLGYHCPRSGRIDAQTRVALRAFQTDQGIDPSGELDSSTESALRQHHGGT